MAGWEWWECSSGESNSQGERSRLCAGMCLKGAGKSSCTSLSQGFPNFLLLLQELGSAGSPTLPSPKFPSWRGHGSRGRHNHTLQEPGPLRSPNPILFSWDPWELRACSTARGMVKQPWHGCFSCRNFSLLSLNPGRFWEHNVPGNPSGWIQGRPLQMGSDRRTNVHGCFYMELGNGSPELKSIHLPLENAPPVASSPSSSSSSSRAMLGKLPWDKITDF